jgi:hypothetical protein
VTPCAAHKDWLWDKIQALGLSSEDPVVSVYGFQGDVRVIIIFSPLSPAESREAGEVLTATAGKFPAAARYAKFNPFAKFVKFALPSVGILFARIPDHYPEHQWRTSLLGVPDLARNTVFWPFLAVFQENRPLPISPTKNL